MLDYEYENEYTRSLEIDEKQVCVRVVFQEYQGSTYDEKYRPMNHYIRNSESFLVMYSVYDSESFEYAEAMMRQVEKVKGYHYNGLELPAILVAYDDPGAKISILDNMNVTTEQVEKLTKEWRVKLEKAKIENENDVTRIFETAVRMALENRVPESEVPQPKKKCCLM
jgi:hypothetical protein